jgi:putative ABC transport system permease protein
MAIAMACAILILLWVQKELSYDKFHKNADSLFRIIENQEDVDLPPCALTPNALAPALKEEYPGIIRSSRYEGRAFPIQKNDDYIVEVGAFVDKDFLQMFNIKFVFGDIKNAFNGPHDLIITEEMAHKYFGNEDPLGKTVKSMNFIFNITGVVKSFPQNSHIQFDFLIPFKFYTELGADLNAWGFNATYSYIELQEGTNSKMLESKIKNILQIKNKDSRADIFLQNIKKIHLYSYGKYDADISGHGDITYIKILSIIAIFILIIACINFMNLSTAQSARRAKVIGVHQVAGANKGNVVFQFIGESFLIVIAAHVVAMILVELLLPVFNNIIRNYQSSDLLMMNFNNHISKEVDLNYHSAGLYIGLVTIVLFCGFLAGSYPALYLSSLEPLDTMKGIISRSPGKGVFRKFLVIFQFTLSVLLILCTFIVGKQLKYMQDVNLGFNKENIGYFQFGMGFPREIFKRDIASNPDIVSATFAENPFSGIGTGFSEGFKWDGQNEGEKVVFSTLYSDEDFAKTFQLGMKEGRFFSPEFTTDNTAIVINEKAAGMMGFNEPVGEFISSKDGSKYRIIGVVKDFHFKSLRNKIEPLIMFMYRERFNCFIRVKPGRMSATIDFVRKTFKSYNQTFPLVFKFFDDDYINLYWREQRMSKIFGYFSLLAIIISTLGLIGLSLFMTELRTKEIGIRKINEAKTFEIFFQLSKEYLLWVLISILIASPIAWYIMQNWLQRFAYRIDIKLWVFALTGVMALVVALLTVGFQSYRAANKNPVEALRYE